MKNNNFKQSVLIFTFTVITAIPVHSQNDNSDKDKNSSKKTDTARVNDVSYPVQTIYYTCPLHPKVRSDKAGNCPQCGTTMDRKTEKIIYSCPMHTDVKQDEKGKCEKCGADLEKKD